MSQAKETDLEVSEVVPAEAERDRQLCDSIPARQRPVSRLGNTFRVAHVPFPLLELEN